jgi:hypothetical protein
MRQNQEPKLEVSCGEWCGCKIVVAATVLDSQMKNLVLTVIALWSYSAFAQAQHGTVIVVNFTKDKVIIAADSRAMNSDTRRPPDDCRCKISAFGKKIVFTTSGTAVFMKGSTSDPVEGWDNSEIANRAARESRYDLDKTVLSWSSILADHWKSAYLWHSDMVIHAAEIGNGVITVGLFFQAETGKYKAVAVTFDRSRLEPIQMQLGDLSACWPCGQQDGARICVVGRIEAVDSICSKSKGARDIIGNMSLDSLKTTNESALLAIRLVDLAASLTATKDVGGKIDAIEIEKGALHWIARKPNCPEDQD